MNYYDQIAPGYNRLHQEEQLLKLSFVLDSGLFAAEDVLLDVGCGTGFCLDKYPCKNVHGIDPAKKLVEQYRGKHSIHVASAESLPFADQSFDVVVSLTAAQNFSDPLKALEEIRRVGKNRFIITFLRRSAKRELLTSLIHNVFEGFSIASEEYVQDVVFFINKV